MTQLLKTLDPDTPWYEAGEEPDYRFSLANERTFLAWIRTALALMAGAVGVTVVKAAGLIHVWLIALGVALAVLAMVISAFTYSQWAAKQKAMRLNRALPRPWLLIPVSVVMSVIAVTLVAIVVSL